MQYVENSIYNTSKTFHRKVRCIVNQTFQLNIKIEFDEPYEKHILNIEIELDKPDEKHIFSTSG